MSRPRKHSLTLGGHRTSVTLEDEFWAAFREIAAAEGKGLNQLAAEIDAARGIEAGLATAIRLYVLRFYRSSGGSQGRPARTVSSQ
ncbi:MAG: ribbon-helix-helix domain-containing protein [Paracoccaceae bacterium]|jgi:predicted DNA-binding ribbon-helix-helix protein